MTTTDVVMFCRITVMLVFALSVVGKAQDINAFQEAILDFQLLSPSLSKLFSWIFLSAETLVVLLMITNDGLLLLGFTLAALLLITFAFALVLVLQRHRRVVCNCFGRTEQRISWYDVVRNILLTACSLLGIWTLIAPQQSVSITNVILIALMAICFVIIVTNTAGIVETLRRPIHMMR